jgi:hypothetical protein
MRVRMRIPTGFGAQLSTHRTYLYTSRGGQKHGQQALLSLPASYASTLLHINPERMELDGHGRTSDAGSARLCRR